MMRLTLFTLVMTGAFAQGIASASDDLPQKKANESLEQRRGSLDLHKVMPLQSNIVQRSRLLKKHDHEDKEKMIEANESGLASDEDILMDGKPNSPPEKDSVIYSTDMPSNTPGTDDAPYYATSSPPKGDASDGGNTTPVFQSKTNKGKARKVSARVCTKRLKTAFDEIKAFPGGYTFGVKNITIQTQEDVTKLCSFVAPSFPSNDVYNSACPFFYLPVLRDEVNYFPRGVKEYRAIPDDDGSIGHQQFQVWASVALYCSCYQGYDLGCSNKLPTTPQEKDEYCEFAGVWNGDISIKDVELSETMLDCGCYWISEVTTDVGKCPGVDLGWWNNKLNFTEL